MEVGCPTPGEIRLPLFLDSRRWASEATLKKYSGQDSERQRLLFPNMSRGKVIVEEAESPVVEEDSSQLSPEEERVLRMRSGATLSGHARLESKFDDVAPELKIKVIAQLEELQREAVSAIQEQTLRAGKKDKIILRLSRKTMEKKKI